MGLTFDKDCIRLKSKSSWKQYIQLSTKSQLWTYIQIPFPQIIQDKTLPHQIRLNPSWIWFQVDYVYIDNWIWELWWVWEQSKDCILNKKSWNILSLDLWVRNLSGILKERSEVQKPPTKCATWFNCNTCESIIINGKRILGWSKFYKYIDSYLKSQLNLQSNKSWTQQRTSKRLQQRQVYYKNRMRDFTHKASKLIINYCLENDVSKVIIGYNPWWKKDLKKRRQLWKKNRSEFVLLPYTSFIEKLKYKWENYGIKVVLQEESYTSKVDHLVWESMEHHEEYLWKRSGKLFKSSCWITLNSDMNWAIGIMKKYLERDENKDKTNLSSKEKINYEVFKRNLKWLVVKGGVDSPIRTNVI